MVVQPGLCGTWSKTPKTGFSHNEAHFSIFTASDTIIYLALLPPNVTAPKGAFVAERVEIPFKGPDYAFDAAAAGTSLAKATEILETMKKPDTTKVGK